MHVFSSANVLVVKHFQYIPVSSAVNPFSSKMVLNAVQNFEAAPVKANFLSPGMLSCLIP